MDSDLPSITIGMLATHTPVASATAALFRLQMAVLDGPVEWFWKIAEVWKRRKLTCGLKSIGKRAKRQFPERAREM